MPTKIEWAQETWSPIVGCSHISAGCDHCYAERMANRLAAIYMKNINKNPRPAGIGKYAQVINWNGKWNGSTNFHEPDLEKPLKWKKPRMIFVVSMGDLFHESVPFEWIDQIFNEVITKCDHHTFLILTKRPENMRKFFNDYSIWSGWNNVWLGVTTENQEMADKRIPVLLNIAAKRRFVSIEPMLSQVILRQNYVDYLTGWETLPDKNGEMMQSQTEVLDWVITGGETGPGAQPIHPDWVRSIRDQCQEAGVPFFFKSWGGKNRKSYLIDGKEWREMP